MILIKLASRSRPAKFARTLENIKRMTLTPYKVIVSADDNDRTMNNKQMLKHVSNFKNVQMFFGPYCTKVEAINRDMDKAGEWNILVNMSDDFVFKVRGWDQVLRQKIADNWPEGDCFVHLSDGYVHDKLCTISIMDRKYYERDNYIYHPSYKSFSCDSEAWYVAIARKRHKYFPEVLFTHEHPANNRKLKNDALYKINSYHSSHDVKNYFERLNRDFDLTIPGPFPWDQYKTV